MLPDSSHDTSNRYMLLRVVAGVLAVICTPAMLRYVYVMLRGWFDPLLTVFAACTTLFVAFCIWFAMRGHLATSRARIKMAVMFGIVLGAIGFAVGFFGPMMWAPDANQGPLLGIFITGPIGFVVGIAFGWIYAGMRVRSGMPSRI
jgi:hypothetical protein